MVTEARIFKDALAYVDECPFVLGTDRIESASRTGGMDKACPGAMQNDTQYPGLYKARYIELQAAVRGLLTISLPSLHHPASVFATPFPPGYAAHVCIGGDVIWLVFPATVGTVFVLGVSRRSLVRPSLASPRRTPASCPSVARASCGRSGPTPWSRATSRRATASTPSPRSDLVAP